MSKLLIIISIFIVSGCEGPKDTVHDSDNMEIFYAQVVDSPKGKYEYWITDATSNWRLTTDKKFNIGDRVSIEKNNSKNSE